MAFNLKKEGNLALSCNIDEFQRHHFKSQKPWGTVYKVSETAELLKKSIRLVYKSLWEERKRSGPMDVWFPFFHMRRVLKMRHLKMSKW